MRKYRSELFYYVHVQDSSVILAKFQVTFCAGFPLYCFCSATGCASWCFVQPVSRWFNLNVEGICHMSLLSIFGLHLNKYAHGILDHAFLFSFCFPSLMLLWKCGSVTDVLAFGRFQFEVTCSATLTSSQIWSVIESLKSFEVCWSSSEAWDQCFGTGGWSRSQNHSISSRTLRLVYSVQSRSRSGRTLGFWSRLVEIDTQWQKIIQLLPCLTLLVKPRVTHCHLSCSSFMFSILWSKVFWTWLKLAGKAAKC